MARLHQDADQLAKLAQTIPSDVLRIQSGVLPKDMSEKLKQIEKLSKHLRSQIMP
jgi:flagellar motor component MotA